ncbi:S1 RNA-binding domain-containing protein [Candidatus Microgenomates bacterium]|nr:S1 RNA-binding domain-containing protein [Candidatus Microgenomates bacterium]
MTIKKSQISNLKSQKETKSSKPSPKEPTSMAELLAQTGYTPHGLRKRSEVEGIITSLSPKGILIDLGAKTEGVVLEKDKKILDDLLATLRVGDRVKALVLSPESEDGHAVLSLRRARKNKAWQELEQAFEQGKTAEVEILESSKNGLLITYATIRGFIPSSHLISSQDELTSGKRLLVKILEVNPKDNRLIASEKLATIDLDKLRKEFIEIKINDVFTGTITGVTKFGIFVNIKENLDGLVHISEVSWDRVGDLEEQFKIGDKVEVLVTNIDKENLRLSLSLKQLRPDPWLELSQKFAVDQQVKGRISKTSKIGIHVALEDGLEGLIHQSKIPLGKEFTEGEKITCVVESVDKAKHRISLIPVLKEKPVGYR